MQIYKNNLNLLSQFLDFLKHKIDSGTLTLGEAEGLKRIFLENISLSGTAEDIAAYYHRSPQDVRNVIHRKMLSRPERKVHYDFVEFMQIAPEKWKG